MEDLGSIEHGADSRIRPDWPVVRSGPSPDSRSETPRAVADQGGALNVWGSTLVRIGRQESNLLNQHHC
jgi:hypothetical protein